MFDMIPVPHTPTADDCSLTPFFLKKEGSSVLGALGPSYSGPCFPPPPMASRLSLTQEIIPPGTPSHDGVPPPYLYSLFESHPSVFFRVICLPGMTNLPLWSSECPLFCDHVSLLPTPLSDPIRSQLVNTMRTDPATSFDPPLPPLIEKFLQEPFSGFTPPPLG